MKPNQQFKLSGAHIEAILAALPIIENYPAATPNQQFLNSMSCQEARSKLLSWRKDFSPNELRVIAVAVVYASEYLSGRMPELEKLLPGTSAIRQYALSYVQLRNYFSPLLSDPGV